MLQIDREKHRALLPGETVVSDRASSSLLLFCWRTGGTEAHSSRHLPRELLDAIVIIILLGWLFAGFGLAGTTPSLFPTAV